MKLSFHGGAREVTGSCFLIETQNIKILVDCGMFQGPRVCSEHNFEKFRFNPQEINAVVVTHAHIDHIGRIPKLLRDGFRGKIYSTAPTRDLARPLLEDALDLAERKDEALYSHKDLEAAFASWEDVSYEKQFVIGDLSLVFRDAGHILGSAFIELMVEGKRVLLTGDIGNVPSALLPAPGFFRNIEYLVIESTYGSRTHEAPEERILGLERAVEDIASRGGVLVIPTFATERTQDILFLLNEMLLLKRIPEMPVFVDSPLAIRITKIYEQYPSYYKDEIRELFQKHPNLFKFKKLKFTETVEESKAINDAPRPKVILAGSGMMQGGRILHHLRRYLPDHNSILLIVGYQAAGSLGRRLIDGEKMIKLFSENVPVHAEIRKINGFSAHADNPQLFSFVESTKDTLKRVFVVQGEEASSLHFMQEIRDRLGIQADAPELYEEFEI